MAMAAGTMIAVFLPLWYFQWSAIGHPFGFHLGSHMSTSGGVVAHILSRPQVFYDLIVAANPSAVVSMCISVPFIVVAVWNPRFSKRAFRFAVPMAAVVATVSAVFILDGYAFAPSPITFMHQANSLFSASPFLILGFIRPSEPNTSNANNFLAAQIRAIILLYAALYICVAPNMGSTGVHWGNRFLLVLYPLMTLLALRPVSLWFNSVSGHRHLLASSIYIVIILSFLAQIYAIHLVGTKKNFSARLNAEIAALPNEIIVTNIWWFPQEAFREFRTRPVFYINSPQQYQHLVHVLERNCHNTLLFAAQQPISSTARR